MRHLTLSAVATTIFIACSSAQSSHDAGVDAGTISGDPNVQVGAFVVRVPSETGSPNVAVVGKVYDGPTPQLLVWETSSESGACKLLKPRVPFCSTACGGSAACIENETCQNYPAAKSVGVVTVTGIETNSGAEFSMSPVANTYQPPADISLPSNAVSEGDTIRFSAAGGAYAPFTLEAKGIAPLSLTNPSIPVAENQAVSLSWPSAQASTGSRVKVKLDISHHGGSKGKIECDAPDTGALEIPAPLVTQLLALGVAGFPTIISTRQTVGSATIAAGRVDLIVSSEVERAVSIAGLESCSSDAECTLPKKCQPDLTCQ